MILYNSESNSLNKFYDLEYCCCYCHANFAFPPTYQRRAFVRPSRVHSTDAYRSGRRSRNSPHLQPRKQRAGVIS